MLDMIENEQVGMVLPFLRGKYGDEKVEKLIDACIEVDAIKKLPKEYKAMVEDGFKSVDMETGKTKKGAGEKVKKSVFSGSIVFKKANGEVVRFEKYNPWHGKDGRFTSAKGGGGGTYVANRKIKQPWGENNSLTDIIDPKTGKIPKERAAEYSRIVNKFLEGVEPPADGKPTLDYMGGGGGSGKSFAIKSGVVDVPGQGKAVQINADDIKLEFAEFRKRAASDDPAISMGAAGYIHEESSIVTKMLTKAAMDKGVNIVIDGVASNPKKIEKQIEQAKAAGYETIRAHYVATPLEVAVQANRDRYYNNKNKEERRFVPEDVVISAHKEVSANFGKLMDLFPEAELVVNDRKTPVRQVASKKNGGKLAITDQNAFDEFIAKKDA